MINNENIIYDDIAWLDIKIPEDCKVIEYNNDILEKY